MHIISSSPSLRMELRLPRADANPYLTIAATLAAGIGGMDAQSELPAAMLTKAVE